MQHQYELVTDACLLLCPSSCPIRAEECVAADADVSVTFASSRPCFCAFCVCDFSFYSILFAFEDFSVCF